MRLLWGENMEQTIRQELLGLAEEKYASFSAALLPGVDGVLGVRLPALRRLAARIAKEDWRAYLQEGPEDYFEEIMLKGMVIGAAKAPWPETLCEIAQFVPKIDNWSVCDSFCNSLKGAVKSHPAEMWQFLEPYLVSMAPYDVRFAVVMMLSHYLTDDYLEKVLVRLSRVGLTHYYVQMAVAWAISMCYVKNRAVTMPYLEAGLWDDFTYNKALQKIIESRQITDEERQQIRQMKRRPLHR